MEVMSQLQDAKISAMIDAKLDAKLEQITAKSDAKFDAILAILGAKEKEQDPIPTPPEHDTPPEHHQPEKPLQQPESDLKPPTGQISPTKQLKAEDVGFFDPEYQDEKSISSEPIVNTGKHVLYRDVYIFVDRLQDLAETHTSSSVKDVIASCLRGSALMWYSTELTKQEKDVLRHRSTDVDKWYATLIKRFKMRIAVAFAHLQQASYSFRHMRSLTPRAFIQNMLYLAKVVEIPSTYNKIITIYNAFDVSLRIHLPEP